MNTQLIAGGVVVMIIALGGYVYVTQSSADADPRESMGEKESVVETNEMANDTMPTGSGATMQGTDVMSNDTQQMDSDAVMNGDAMTADASEMQSGSYTDYSPEKIAAAGAGKVVLFFYAAWCPSCRPVDAALKSASIPEGLTILRVNYDTETALKQKYGVTYQHTFVQVDAEGKQVTKWSGGSGLADIVARVK